MQNKFDEDIYNWMSENIERENTPCTGHMWRRNAHSFLETTHTSPLAMTDCRHGARCRKFGCVFRHPPFRQKDCPMGSNCVTAGCQRLHPLSAKHVVPPKRTAALYEPTTMTAYDIRLKLKPGTIVLCKRQPSDPAWMSAKLVSLRGQIVTVKFDERSQPEEMPLSAIRCPPPQTPCRHGAACVKFGCMFVHPESRRKDCPRGFACRDPNCVHLHPVAKCDSHSNAISEQLQSQQTNQQLQPQYHLNLRHIHPSANGDSATKNTNLSAKANLHPSAEQNEITISQAEEALHLLTKVVDCNEEFMLSCKNRRLLEILGLKAKKKQAIIDENFLIAHRIKSEIDNLFMSK